LKKLVFIFVFITSALYSQIGYVNVEHPVYDFLERMQSYQIIDNYDPFELPLSRKDVVNFIKTIDDKRNDLSRIDSDILNDLIVEFKFDIDFKTDTYQSLFPKFNVGDHFNQKEKFTYFYQDSSNFNAFINFVGSGELLYSMDTENSTNRNASLFTFGAEVRGSFMDNFGYYLRATNGAQFGDKDLAAIKSNLRYNYKYNENKDDATAFDETEGYLSAEFKYARFKIGRDRMKIGYGTLNSILGNYAPPMDYLSFKMNYSIFSFSFFHGKLLGQMTDNYDPIQGNIRTISDKFLAYHRLSLNFSRHFKLGLGEMIVYSNRTMDLSYLNPFNFYKSAEHANQDRDNSILFSDFQNNSLKGITFYGLVLIDDIDFSELGTDWFGNKILYDFSMTVSPFADSFPFTFGLQYIHIDPYVYTHRIHDNDYTSYQIGLGSNLQPNSQSFITHITYKPHYRVDLKFSFQYTKHGANELDSLGNVSVNHGGDILVGHRVNDSDIAVFLDGILEEYFNYQFIIKYEPIKNYVLTLNSIMIDGKNVQNKLLDDVYLNLLFSLRI